MAQGGHFHALIDTGGSRGKPGFAFIFPGDFIFGPSKIGLFGDIFHFG